MPHRKARRQLTKAEGWEDLAVAVRNIQSVTFVSKTGEVVREAITWDPAINAKRLKQSWADLRKGFKKKLESDPLHVQNCGQGTQVTLPL